MFGIDLTYLALSSFSRLLSARTASLTSTTMPVHLIAPDYPYEFTPHLMGQNPSKTAVNRVFHGLDVDILIEKKRQSQ
jgi:hypothetical protein